MSTKNDVQMSELWRHLRILDRNAKRVTEDAINCWLELAGADDCECALDTFYRLSALAAKMCERIAAHMAQRGA